MNSTERRTPSNLTTETADIGFPSFNIGLDDDHTVVVFRRGDEFFIAKVWGDVPAANANVRAGREIYCLEPFSVAGTTMDHAKRARVFAARMRRA